MPVINLILHEGLSQRDLLGIWEASLELAQDAYREGNQVEKEFFSLLACRAQHRLLALRQARF